MRLVNWVCEVNLYIKKTSKILRRDTLKGYKLKRLSMETQANTLSVYLFNFSHPLVHMHTAVLSIRKSALQILRPVMMRPEETFFAYCFCLFISLFTSAKVFCYYFRVKNINVICHIRNKRFWMYLFFSVILIDTKPTI